MKADDEDLRGELKALPRMIQTLIEKAAPTRSLTVADVCKLMRVSRTKVFAVVKAANCERRTFALARAACLSNRRAGARPAPWPARR